MADKRRVERLNSLLREVISEVILREVKNPHVSSMVSVTTVSITPDLRYAKVYVNVIGSDEDKEETLKALTRSAGFIGSHSSKKVSLRYFPSLTFILDKSLDDQMRIEEILQDVKKEKDIRDADDDNTSN